MTSTATQPSPAGEVRPLSATAGLRNLSLGYLRAFLTLLVVAHHAFLAYHPYAPPSAKSLNQNAFWTIFPVVDNARWNGIEAFIGFNDVFFMSLMFLVSGIFLPQSLRRKGASTFLRDRLLRLGLPFIVGAALLAPLGYYPAYLVGDRNGTFWQQWLALDFWPAGPSWFLWVLLAFGAIAAGIQALNPNWSVILGRFTGQLAKRPILYFLFLIGISAVAYLPMAWAFTAERWFTVGPFAVQSSRVLHYAVYFFAGVGLGAAGIGQGLLASDGKLARRWYLWSGAAIAAFILAGAVLIAIVSSIPKGGPALALVTLGNLCFVLSCAASSLMFLALFLRFTSARSCIKDSLARNAFGIYLLHYFCVSWLQYALLNADLSAQAKALIVFLGAVAASWFITAALRRIPAVARVI